MTNHKKKSIRCMIGLHKIRPLVHYSDGDVKVECRKCGNVRIMKKKDYWKPVYPLDDSTHPKFSRGRVVDESYNEVESKDA